MTDVAAKASMAVEETITQLGFELADAEYVRENGQMCLNFYIWRENGVGIEDCETVSKAIDPLLDEVDPTAGKPYCLCVSTWGDRPLKTERDFQRFMEKEVEVFLKTPMKGKKKKFVGILKAVNETGITVLVKGEELLMEKTNLDKVRPYIGF